MKRKTYNNVLKAGKLIQAKGYSEKESLEIAVQKFDELASLKNGMSVEWLIDKMVAKTEREGESMKLSESDKSYFKKCGYLDQDIPQIEKAIEVMTYTKFLRNIDKYVGYVVEFKSRFKSNGQEYTFQRYVWDNKEFGALKPDSLIDIVSVKPLYKKATKRTETGINYI